MIKIGQYNNLKVAKIVDFGLYLDGGEAGEILLPARYIDEMPEPGDEMNVFIYKDSEDRLIATTERPFATVGEFAFLQVNEVNKIGAFMEWGLPKDLLVPYSEQKAKMKQGGIYLVYLYLDDATKRIVASAKIDKFLGNKIPRYAHGEKVKALVYSHNELGYKCVVDNLFHGLIYQNETFRPVELGVELDAYVKRVREDGKIDLTISPMTTVRVERLAADILEKLRDNNGKLPVSDHSPAELIQELFQCSKKDFKKAIGQLYKQQLITIEPDHIVLVAGE
ncbi:MAG: GntR family transcriptional regulator [Barnesiella sp.]|nr:GntR family transcriptional regulator [Bacteroidales bacterium]MBD5247833.1 GntR family transcriptional regulator [Barnesiella sp.]